MDAYGSMVAEFQSLLGQKGYSAHETSIKVVFREPVFHGTIIAIPDVHLGAGDGGDIFLNDDPEKPRRLAAVMASVHAFNRVHRTTSRAIQLGDWFDIWRVSGEDPRNMNYGAIENVRQYQEILEWDAKIGLVHIIGNHDAGFLRSLPNMRVDPRDQAFVLGAWLGPNVYALHGHQHDLVPPAGSQSDELAVHMATVIARFVPGILSLEQHIDRLGIGRGIAEWLLESLLGIRRDPDFPDRPRDQRPIPPTVASGSFVVRENVVELTAIAHQVSLMPQSQGHSARVILVGHSHDPCAAWTDAHGEPAVVIDVGSWAFERSTIAIAAGNAVAVFRIGPKV